MQYSPLAFTVECKIKRTIPKVFSNEKRSKDSSSFVGYLVILQVLSNLSVAAFSSCAVLTVIDCLLLSVKSKLMQY